MGAPRALGRGPAVCLLGILWVLVVNKGVLPAILRPPETHPHVFDFPNGCKFIPDILLRDLLVQAPDEQCGPADGNGRWHKSARVVERALGTCFAMPSVLNHSTTLLVAFTPCGPLWCCTIEVTPSLFGHDSAAAAVTQSSRAKAVRASLPFVLLCDRCVSMLFP